MSPAHEPVPSATPLSRPVLWTGWAAAACFALASAYFGANYFATRAQLSLVTQDADFARTEAQALTQRLEAERILHAAYQAQLQKSADLSQLKLIPLASSDAPSQPLALIAWNPLSQEGLLLSENLSPLPSGQFYRVWLTTPAQNSLVTAAAFTPDASGSARALIRTAEPVANALALTLTRETSDTSPAPEGPVLATAKL